MAQKITGVSVSDEMLNLLNTVNDMIGPREKSELKKN